MASNREDSYTLNVDSSFSHAPAAKRQLMQLDVPFITLEGTIGGGLLAAVTLNAIAASVIEKPNCHCYLSKK